MRRLHHLFQADLLGGFTWLHQGYREEEYSIDRILATDTTRRYDRSYDIFYATLGPSLRYRTWKKLELTGDLLFNWQLGGYSGFSRNQVMGSRALGLRYRFGRV